MVYLAQSICAIACHTPLASFEEEKEDDEKTADRRDGNPQMHLTKDDTKSTKEEEDIEAANIYAHSDDPAKDHRVREIIERDEQSLFSTWTNGPGPFKKEDITKSSLDGIFGRRF